MKEAQDKYISDLAGHILNNVLKPRSYTKEELEKSCAYLAALLNNANHKLDYLLEKSGKPVKDATAEFEGLLDKDKDIWIKGFDSGITTRNKAIATSGGAVKKEQMEKLEKLTIDLYKEKTWKSAPEAALEITPKIVEFSKGAGDLLPSTSKPLEWIRKYNRSEKSKRS